jgi:carboxymethylenebutenolidase
MGSTTRTVTVTAADGGKFDTYLAMPESGSGPGLVLLHEILGVNRHIRDLASLYADEGYVTIAPDLFWRLRPGVDLSYSQTRRSRISPTR